MKTPPEQDLEDLYERAPCGYLSTSSDGTLIRVNQTFLDWTGYGADDLVGRRKFSDLLSAGGRIFYETHLSPLLRMQGSAREIALDVVCADGAHLPVLVTSVLRSDQDGKAPVIRTAVFAATDRRQYERELLLARQSAEKAEARARKLALTLQESFIPPATLEIPGLDVGGMYRPAGRGDEVGGDFYDVFQTADGEWGVVLGDVEGKGPEAAGTTSLARYTIRAAAMRTTHPRQILETLNQALCRESFGRFCTSVYAHIDRRGSAGFSLNVAAGGHPPPLLVSPARGPRPIGLPGTLLGLFEDASFSESTVELSPGDALVFYTDGVIEARKEGEWFGEEGLKALLEEVKGLKAGAIAERVANVVVDFQAGLPHDDIAIVVLKVPEEAR